VIGFSAMVIVTLAFIKWKTAFHRTTFYRSRHRDQEVWLVRRGRSCDPSNGMACINAQLPETILEKRWKGATSLHEIPTLEDFPPLVVATVIGDR
jgi:hypothetical protein